jgi:hypothetical protein
MPHKLSTSPRRDHAVMTLRWRRLAGCVAAAVVVGIAQGPAVGHAEGCERTVSVSPQVSGGEGTGNLTFAVYSTGCNAAGEVTYRVEPGSASSADFTLANGVVRWAAGETQTRYITAQLRPDLEAEPAIEDFTVWLVATTPTVRLALATGHGRILDDDGPVPSSAVDDAACLKASYVIHRCVPCETQMMPKACVVFELSVPADGGTPMTARWSTVDGTAEAGVDYVPVLDQVTTVPIGGTDVALPVQVLPRPPGTPTRWFEVRISAVSLGLVVDAVAVVTILG